MTGTSRTWFPLPAGPCTCAHAGTGSLYTWGSTIGSQYTIIRNPICMVGNFNIRSTSSTGFTVQEGSIQSEAPWPRFQCEARVEATKPPDHAPLRPKLLSILVPKPPQILSMSPRMLCQNQCPATKRAAVSSQKRDPWCHKKSQRRLREVKDETA